MENILSVASITAITIGLSQVFKQIGLLTRWVPLLNLVEGVVMICVVQGLNTTAVLTGLVVGLMASGVWSGTKATIGQ